MGSEMFRRALIPLTDSRRILLDPALPQQQQYTDSFGFEWTKIDGFVGKEVMSHGHLFGRFLLPVEFFKGKSVADVGCGNGRIGRLIIPDCSEYVGVDMSNSLSAFPTFIENFEAVSLVKASATDLPLEDNSVDIALCWGVLHHTDDPSAAFSELTRITKPGGYILIYVYPPKFDGRRNFNQLVRQMAPDISFRLVEQISDELDDWCEVDEFYGSIIAQHLHMGRKQSRSWQIFQWFDGISPKFHWSLAEGISEMSRAELDITVCMPGVFKIRKRD